MINLVPGHLVAGAEAASFAGRLSASVARRVEVSADAINFTFSTAVLALQAHCVADPEADTLETWQATVTAMQLGSTLFAVTGMSEGTAECFINGKARTLKAIGIDGAVALGPLAMACLAYDGKLPIGVESDYLPKELMEFGWAGEMDA
ncbi:Imm49 family immunity protein [Streptomyces sp. NPDC059979]|uniref:Imm49 family immunity protein n=1 Tax=unclassified Streptomyces TaxID=2593676 RepID=UPI00364A8301